MTLKEILHFINNDEIVRIIGYKYLVEFGGSPNGLLKLMSDDVLNSKIKHLYTALGRLTIMYDDEVFL